MSLRHISTIDELLGDSLVQAVMRADNVEPQALRILLADTAARVAAARVEQRLASGLSAKPPTDRRPASRGANALARVRPALFPDACGSTLCC
jgi:hypothetical protein